MESVKTQQEAPAIAETLRRRWFVGWTSLVFIILQSGCTAFMAMSGLQLAIGISSTAMASVLLPFAKLHVDVLRIPMVLLALLGSLANLHAIWRMRRLRARPASQWRVQAMTLKQRRNERLQITLAIVTLVLLALEESLHIYLHHVM